MSDSLRDRIADIVDAADTEAAKNEGGFALATGDDVAQAIIDSLNLVTYESETHIHVAGRWEKK